MSSFCHRAIGPPQGFNLQPFPAFDFFVALGIAIKRPLEVSKRNHETGPAIAKAKLEHVVLDESPYRMPEGAPHGNLFVRQHAGANGRVTIGLCKNLLEILKRKLHECVLKLSDWLAALHHDGLVNDSCVAHRAPAIEF